MVCVDCVSVSVYCKRFVDEDSFGYCVEALGVCVAAVQVNCAVFLGVVDYALQDVEVSCAFCI